MSHPRDRPTTTARLAVLSFLRAHPEVTLERLAELRDSTFGATLESITVGDLIGAEDRPTPD